jgi:hypothetical protein
LRHTANHRFSFVEFYESGGQRFESFRARQLNQCFRAVFVATHIGRRTFRHPPATHPTDAKVDGWRQITSCPTYGKISQNARECCPPTRNGGRQSGSQVSRFFSLDFRSRAQGRQLSTAHKMRGGIIKWPVEAVRAYAARHTVTTGADICQRRNLLSNSTAKSGRG